MTDDSRKGSLEEADEGREAGEGRTPYYRQNQRTKHQAYAKHKQTRFKHSQRRGAHTPRRVLIEANFQIKGKRSLYGTNTNRYQTVQKNPNPISFRNINNWTSAK